MFRKKYYSIVYKMSTKKRRVDRRYRKSRTVYKRRGGTDKRKKRRDTDKDYKKRGKKG